MTVFEIQPVLRTDLPDVAGFIQRWRDSENTPVPQSSNIESLSIEDRLRWHLAENPAASEDAPVGYCVRDRFGVIRGLNLMFPVAFVSNDKPLTGLCSGSFFVESPARSLGFYLFRKYLHTAGPSFFFATTCNARSAELWSRLGGSSVPNADLEYVLPLRLDTVISAFAASRNWNGLTSRLASLFGKCANPIIERLTSRSAKLILEPCRDWDKLADLFRRHAPRGQITTHLSAKVLQWRYGRGSPLYPCSIYLFRDSQGNEGWFSLGNAIRGERGQIRGVVCLDAVWPRERMAFADISREMLRVADRRADALFLRPQPGLDYREYGRWIVRRNLPAPRIFVKMPKGSPQLALDSLDCGDLDDVAWMTPWAGGSEALHTCPTNQPARRAIHGLP